MERAASGLALALAALLGALGTAGAAYAAHGADPRLAATAAAIALTHAPALLALGLAPPGRLAAPIVPVLALGLGTLLFSGDLAMRIATGERLFANAAPAGGLLLVGGWLSVGVCALAAALRRR